ncbi:DegT/DnrJ/EryC1/StrS family aminotransferase [Terrabacter sp. GCM10028922]|uniref:DegT/DnrJ/EryC1/StrS family aminotransferase n=1 Tax=Terrabacter sp. GCM10028922 TaxID=3273428 RepID=UPI0036079A6A
MGNSTELKRYPVGSPDIGALEEANVLDAVRSTWVSSTGKYLDEFESRFAAACDVQHAVACANGTVALHLALSALGLGPGDEVIVPSLTYVATANTVTYTGATPIFCDVSRDSWCMDPSDVAARITPRTKAIVAVHLYGHPADMTSLAEIASGAGIVLIEDAAEAPFATFQGRKTGSLGVMAAFSFYGNKIITSGEGGAVTTDDAGLAQRLRLLRGQGMDPDRRYFFPVIGFNYRMTNVAAAMLCAQLDRLDELLSRRSAVFATYDQAFESVASLELQQVAPDVTRAPWMFSLLLDSELGPRRDFIMESLGSVGVETRPIFFPLHRLPPYQNGSESDLPVTDDIAGRGFSLPTTSLMSVEDAREVASRLLAILERL